MDDRETREAAADLIDGAIDLIRERGWCKGHLEDVQGQLCLSGALQTADGRNLWRNSDASPALILVWRAIGDEVASFPALTMFNDHPATTLEDVLLTMKRAAHSLREVAA